jgi:uncharacterized membrane protein
MRSVDGPLLTQSLLQPPPHKGADRLQVLDLLRGLIMIVMSWDHCKDFISDGSVPKSVGSEFWSGPFSTYDDNGWLFLSRWISHICAPGFSFLMGMGMTFFAQSRLNKGARRDLASLHDIVQRHVGVI